MLWKQLQQISCINGNWVINEIGLQLQWQVELYQLTGSINLKLLLLDEASFWICFKMFAQKFENTSVFVLGFDAVWQLFVWCFALTHAYQTSSLARTVQNHRARPAKILRFSLHPSNTLQIPVYFLENFDTFALFYQ